MVAAVLVCMAPVPLAEAAGARGAGLNELDLADARDYVFAACLIKRYPGTPLAAEVDVWAGGIVERSRFEADAYPRLDRLAADAPEPMVSRNGTVMRLQSCQEFVSARGFAQRLRTVIGRPVKSR